MLAKVGFLISHWLKLSSNQNPLENYFSDPNESLGSIQHVNNMIKWTLDHIDHVFPN